MSVPFGVHETRLRLPAHRRLAPLVAVGAARLIARLPPKHVAAALRAVRRGAVAATYEQALDARNAVTSVSLRCASGRGCLQRSLATALLCRMRGVWADWCTGVRAQPFRAHAWVEAGSRPVAEPQPADYYRKILVVGLAGARGRRPARRCGRCGHVDHR